MVGVAVVALFSLGLGDALGLASGRDCATSNIVVKKKVVKAVYYKYEAQEQKAMSTTLHMKPGDYFDGVCVKAKDETVHEPLEACFSVKSCELSSTTWNLLKVEAKVVGFMSKEIQFTLTVENCRETETKSYSSSAITRLRVLAKGSSEWRCTDPPNTCPDTTTENLSSCSPSMSPVDPDTTAENPLSLQPSMSSVTPDTTTENFSSEHPSLSLVASDNPEASKTLSPTMVMAISLLAVVVVVMVVVTAVVATRKRKPRITAPQTVLKYWESTGPGAATRGSVDVSENSLYEPVSGSLATILSREQRGAVQAIENSLYEPLPGPVTPAATKEQGGAVQAIENSLYEPLSGPLTPAATKEQRGAVQVIENSLYEPLSGPLTPAATKEQQGAVQVIENSLYEPLPGPLTPAATKEQQGAVQVIENSLYEPLPGPH